MRQPFDAPNVRGAMQSGSRPEFVFATLPPAGFDVPVGTSKGTPSYRVTAGDRVQIMRVCN